MKKLTLIICAIVTGLALYIYLDPDLKQRVTEKIENTSPASARATTLYKWKDNTGQLKVSDTPPPAGVPYETLNYHSETNIVPSQSLSREKPE